MDKKNSIILSIRNERKYISRCLYSILSRYYPEDKDRDEILRQSLRMIVAG
jgi:cellulose synthase/poly-beta-1,6-N-acetylglucosamine synthase-like glycosyltransferase